MIKYEILEDKKIEYNGKILCKIKALKDFANVKKGDLGGYVENYNNLSQEDNCWIYDNAKVYGNARVYDNAKVFDNAEVYGDAKVFGHAKVFDYAEVYDYAKIYDNAMVYEYAKVFENARVYGSAMVFGNVEIYNDNTIIGKVCCNFDKIFEIQNPKGRLVTAILKNKKILYSVGCQMNITEEKFRYRIKNDNGGLEKNPHRVEYYKIIEMAKLYFAVK